jgi:hypothetical protein
MNMYGFPPVAATVSKNVHRSDYPQQQQKNKLSLSQLVGVSQPQKSRQVSKKR